MKTVPHYLRTCSPSNIGPMRPAHACSVNGAFAVVSFFTNKRVYARAILIVALSSASACTAVPVAEQPNSPTITAIQQAPKIIDGAIYKTSNNLFLFEDVRARRVGDVINVALEERTDASKTATTSSNKSSSVNIQSPKLFGGSAKILGRDILSNELGGGSDFSGAADSSQSNRLSGNVAVLVTRLLPNGNLWIQGEKSLTLNQGSEIVKVSGQIRPADISPDNTIKSSLIADARITYGGKGLLANSNNAGWLTRFFQSPLWPF